jgi:hypothetical protein
MRDLKRVERSPEIEMLLNTEIHREDGHPDFEYSRRKFDELDIAEKERSELIAEAFDGMNAHFKGKSYPKKLYSASTPMEPAKISDEEKPSQPITTTEKPRERRHFPFGKVVGALLVVIVMGALLWYGPAIISYVKDYSAQSSFTKLTLMNSPHSTKVQFGGIDYDFSYSVQNDQGYLGVEDSLLETKLYTNPTNGSDYKDIGIEIQVSEVYSDHIVVLVKPTIQNYLAQLGYTKMTIANGQYQTVNFSENEYIFAYAYTLVNSYNQGMVNVPELTITTSLLQTEQYYLSTPADNITSKLGLNVIAWAVPEYVTLFVKPSY